MFTLFGKQGSGSATIEAALEIVGAPYRVEETASWEKNAAFDELLRVNPMGQIPTLVLPDGSALSESAAILAYLADAFPACGLLPGDASARAQALRGLVFIAANCYSAISIIDFPERWCVDGDEPVLQKIRNGARARLHRHWEIFADLFTDSGLIGSERVGALDLYAVVVSKWSGTRAHLKEFRPALYSALQRVEANHVVAMVFSRHWPAQNAAASK